MQSINNQIVATIKKKGRGKIFFINDFRHFGNSEASDWQVHKIEAKKLSARKILIHTLSHLLIRKFELAVCHFCTLVPDTSCEMNNLFLDRRLIIDKEFGYFIS